MPAWWEVFYHPGDLWKPVLSAPAGDPPLRQIEGAGRWKRQAARAVLESWECSVFWPQQEEGRELPAHRYDAQQTDFSTDAGRAWHALKFGGRKG